MSDCSSPNFKVTALVQGNEERPFSDEWLIASPDQLELLKKAGLTYLAAHGEGRFTTVEASFAAAEGTPVFRYRLTPQTERYCRHFILENLDTGKKRRVIVVETPEFV